MKSVTPALHYAALMRLRDIIRESFVAEIHPDYKKVNGVRLVTNPINRQVMIAVLYGCVSMADIPYRSKTTLKLFLDKNEKTKAYSYETSNIEILRGTAESLTQPSCKISMDVGMSTKRRLRCQRRAAAGRAKVTPRAAGECAAGVGGDGDRIGGERVGCAFWN